METCKVSVVIPCRNEERYIHKCLNSILFSSHKNVEILVVDGMSTDGTQMVLRNYPIRLLYNRLKTTQHAVNIGFRHATGDYILEMDAHSTISPNYISECIKVLKKYPNSVVGGITTSLPGSNTHIGKCIAVTNSDAFGVGRALWKQETTKLREVPSIHCVMRGKEVFKKVGGYNEKLTHSHDLEHTVRTWKAGIKIRQIPGIYIYYYARPDLKSLIKKAFSDGQWVILPRKLCSTRFLTLRHFAPLLFILTLPVSIFPYVLMNIYRSIYLAFKKKVYLMPLVFFVLHITYGLGSLYALIKILYWEVRDALHERG